MKSGLNVVYAITVVPRRNDSYMFHYPNAEMGEVVARAIGLKPIKKQVSGVKEKEVDELMEIISMLDIDGLVIGTIASKYQKERVDRISNKLGLEVYAPLWEMNPEEYMSSLLRDGFKVMIIGVYAMGIEHLLGRIIDENVLLFRGVPSKIRAWASHMDEIKTIPENFVLTATSEICLIESMRHKKLPIFGVQFHPEVTHTEYGKDILRNFYEISLRYIE